MGLEIWKFISAIGLVFTGFFLNQKWQQTKERRQQLLNVISLLSAVEQELCFYTGKLNVLVAFLDKHSTPNLHGNVTGIVVPSYNFHPAFLEKSKGMLIDYHETAELVVVVGECQFELSHIQYKLEHYRVTCKDLWGRAESEELMPSVSGNRVSLRNLAEANAKSFSENRSMVIAKLDQMKALLTEHRERDFFGSFLE